MNKAKSFLILVVLSAFFSQSWVRAQDEKPTLTCDLQKCIALALEKNPGLQASKANVDVYKAMFDLTKVDFRPKLYFTGGPGAITGRPVSDYALVRGVTEEGIPVQRASGSYFVLGYTLDFPIFHNGAFLGLGAASVNQARKAVSAEGFKHQAAIDKTIQDVTTAYFNVLMDQEDVRSTSKNYDYQKLRYDVASGKFDLDLISRSMLLTDASSLASAEADFANARQTLSLAVTNLACSMGVAPETQIVIQESAEEPGPSVPANVDNLVDAAVRNRPEILAQKAAVESAKAGVKSVQRERMPTLEASANYSLGDDFDPPTNTLWQVMLRMRMDVFDGGATTAKLKEALALAREQEYTLIQLRQSIVQEIVQAYTDLSIARNHLNAAEKQLDLSREELKLTKEKFQQNLVSTVDVAGAEATLTKSEADCNKARYDLRLKHARLMRAARL
jgi:outer membrane protein TolC